MHTHSSASDGTFSAKELIEEAIRKRLYAFALTDHDTVSGLEELELAAKNASYDHAVPGVELSSKCKDISVHICGLFIDRKNELLNNALKRLRDERHGRNLKIIEKLKKLGFSISVDEVLDTGQGESVGRPHIASLLVSKGYFKYKQDVFDSLLKRGKPAYFERGLLSPEEAISLIHEAGGLAIWAHPFAANNIDRKLFREVLNELKSSGLDGIEAYYSTYNYEIQEYLISIANEEKLLLSGGSDFHGANMDGIEMGLGFGGLNIPDEVYEKLAAASRKYNNFKKLLSERL